MRLNGNEISIEPGVFFGQMASVLFGLFLILLGVAIFHTIAYWARRGRKVEGEVIGIRRKGYQIHSVYRYLAPQGGWREATSVQGGSSLKGRSTGSHRMIRVIADHPEEAREPAAPILWILAFGLVLGGAWVTWSYATAWKRSIFTWIFFAAIAGGVGLLLWRMLTRLLKTVGAKVGAPEPWTALPMVTAESLGSSPELRAATVSSSRPVRTSAIFCVVGLVTFAIAAIPIRQLLQLRSGTRVAGTVLWLEMNTANHNNHAKFPEVQFTAADGTTTRFLDRAGANPSPYKAGDKVTVLYQPGKANSAMVDHGLHNWEPVVGLLVLGTTFLGLGLLTLRGGFVAVRQTGQRDPLGYSNHR